MRNEAVEKAVSAMEDLPRSQREAIWLRHIEGWTLKEMASHFNRSEAAVAGLLKRGLYTLKKNLNAIENQ
jgi:RNA polymerase sigma-70 factor (ECF subfamily)